MQPSHKSLMSRPAILDAYNAGEIVIDPFDPDRVGTNQYDVTLGSNFFRARPPGQDGVNEYSSFSDSNTPVYNPFDQQQVEQVWVNGRVWRHEDAVKVLKMTPLKGIGLGDEIIFLQPGETILAHTDEFIGGACASITTMMKARSSTGRNFIEVCKCAGLGDVGYFNRWTMEITNNSLDYTIPLVVGRRLAQIMFFRVDAVVDGKYTKAGKYQTHEGLEELKLAWKPSDMLPKQWRDREVKKDTL